MWRRCWKTRSSQRCYCTVLVETFRRSCGYILSSSFTVLCPLKLGESSLVLLKQMHSLPDLFLRSGGPSSCHSLVILVQYCTLQSAMLVMIVITPSHYTSPPPSSFRETMAEICSFVSSVLPPISP